MIQELAGMMAVKVVIPTSFYNVSPTDRKRKTDLYLEASEKHEQGHVADLIRREADLILWKAALREAAGELQGKAQGEAIEHHLKQVEHDLKQVVLKLSGNKRPLGSKFLSWEVGQTSGVDVRSVRRRITSWKKGKLLGKGSFGEVYQALTNDGFSFAVKEVSLVGCEQSLLYLEQEISLLSQLQHDNIVRYYGTKKDDEKLYLYLELMTKGSLETLYKRDKLSHSQVSAYVRQILNGLKYLHDQSVAHRDIKCANVLLDASESVKLADFGLAKVIKMNDTNSFKGSAYWMAPEVCNSQNKGYGLAADIWSLGCTVLEMLTCQHPYPDLEGQQALCKLFKRELPPVPDILPRDAQDFILRCLQVDPDERPSAAELLNDPFVGNTSSSFAYPHFNNVQS